MIWLVIILGYILPIIGFYIGVYIKMKSGQTIGHYIDQNDLDDISIWIWIPLFNIMLSIALLISRYVCLIENIKKL